MSNEKQNPTAKHPEAKPGFFTRMVNKLDSSMKEKADAKAKEQSSCCSGDDGKGGKCC
ncbi:hypothetical protein [Cerasicoccus fimbriatus]|uniref:hypothetical protein n=1 Tax=Cerasicoccus fimbriatus TaxID=3014554 RepID=UPI0022B4B454|nr:hypothetical protein [Cerasicoccus sp. TK19100]